ncbi:MAG: hypothetical protein V3T86_07170 [Planctomycetota bacterium]
MIAVLRLGAFLGNLVPSFLLPLWLGASIPVAVAIAASCFLLCWWACGRAPKSVPADPAACADAGEIAEKFGVAAPRYVGVIAGDSAGVVRKGLGYAVLLGADLPEAHRRAVLAHEVAHVVQGDLFWEPFADGPLRLLLPVVRMVPPVVLVCAPLLLFGVRLARTTELRADRLAASVVSSYPLVLHELASFRTSRPSLLYPTLDQRQRVAAQRS